jgi:hypothetical protein
MLHPQRTQQQLDLLPLSRSVYLLVLHLSHRLTSATSLRLDIAIASGHLTARIVRSLPVCNLADMLFYTATIHPHPLLRSEHAVTVPL